MRQVLKAVSFPELLVVMPWSSESNRRLRGGPGMKSRRRRKGQSLSLDAFPQITFGAGWYVCFPEDKPGGFLHICFFNLVLLERNFGRIPGLVLRQVKSAFFYGQPCISHLLRRRDIGG